MVEVLELASPPLSSKKPTQFGPMDRASPYLRTPVPTQERTCTPTNNVNQQTRVRKNISNATYKRPCTYAHAYFNDWSP
jgi:hypothetical protein